MFWEQESWQLEFQERGFTPIDILEQLGKTGREALLEIFLINYNSETEDFRKNLYRFKKNSVLS